MASSDWFSPAKVALLTGAGFTKNFGGYLASEMWALIFSERSVADTPSLRQAMLNELNYEAVYDCVMKPESHFSKPERQIFLRATQAAYQRLHEAIFPPKAGKFGPEGGHVCRSLIARLPQLVNDPRLRSYFFTLNQDLFVERFYSSSDVRLTLPGLSCKNWFSGRLDATLNNGSSRVALPNEAAVESLRESFNKKTSQSGRAVYVKLHGSVGWTPATGDTDVMVIGHSKAEMIKGEPLLRWYLSLFDDVLSAGNVKLIVIGYSFRDEHINKLIAKAVKNHGLRLYLVSPKQPEQFRAEIVPVHSLGGSPVPYGDDIWSGLYGYYQEALTEVFGQPLAGPTEKAKAIFRDLGLLS